MKSIDFTNITDGQYFYQISEIMEFSMALEIVLVLSCKNGCTSNVCYSCFDYQENHNFFLELIETHIFVSQGIIKFERNTKIQMLKKLEGIFHAPLNHLSIIQSLKSRFRM